MAPIRGGPRRSGERPRERVGAIASGEGRKVRVERLVRKPQEEDAPAPRRGRSAAGGEDRPRRRAGSRRALRPAAVARTAHRPPRRDDERPRRPPATGRFALVRAEGDETVRAGRRGRPFRARATTSVRVAALRGAMALRVAARGEAAAASRAAPRGASKGGASKSGFKGGSKGGPRGRR